MASAKLVAKGGEMQTVERVRQAIEIYGRPYWVAYTSKEDRDAVAADVLAELLAVARREVPREERYRGLMRWAEENVFAEVTTKMVMEMAEVSRATALKLLEERPDVFKPLRRGVWEVRDARADREADRR